VFLSVWLILCDAANKSCSNLKILKAGTASAATLGNWDLDRSPGLYSRPNELNRFKIIQVFISNNEHTLDREDRWFERGVKEVIYCMKRKTTYMEKVVSDAALTFPSRHFTIIHTLNLVTKTSHVGHDPNNFQVISSVRIPNNSLWARTSPPDS